MWKHCALNCMQCSSDHITVSWCGLVERGCDRSKSTVHETISSESAITLLLFEWG